MPHAIKLRSSMIDRILFDEDAHSLTIWFRETGKYIYEDVPEPEFRALARAASAGAYFNAYIKGRYRCRFDPARRRHRPVEAGASPT
jgi:hypothetical protein